MSDDTNTCSDESCDVLVSPMPSKRPRPLALLAFSAARRVLFIDSTKNNSDQILSRSRDMLRAKGVEVDEILKKRRASQVMDAPLVDQLLDYEGLVICGVND